MNEDRFTIRALKFLKSFFKVKRYKIWYLFPGARRGTGTKQVPIDLTAGYSQKYSWCRIFLFLNPQQPPEQELITRNVSDPRRAVDSLKCTKNAIMRDCSSPVTDTQISPEIGLGHLLSILSTLPKWTFLILGRRETRIQERQYFSFCCCSGEGVPGGGDIETGVQSRHQGRRPILGLPSSSNQQSGQKSGGHLGDQSAL